VVPAAIAVPDPGCTLAAALRHGSHFLGPLAGNNPADLSFFESLGRAVPRWAFVAPVPLAGARSVVLYADNGPRGIAPRWLAELTLVVARLGQLANAPAKAVTILPEPEIEFVPATLEAADLAAEPEVGAAHAAEHAPGVDASERAILERLRTASHQAGMELGAFVDELLAQRTAKAPADATAALMGEVRGLFERLATDIPAQMALGMQNAFRDIVPRLSPAAVSAPASPAAAAAVELVVGEAKPREVPSYRSRRSKTTKVKL
jgi:hypothetical protein